MKYPYETSPELHRKIAWLYAAYSAIALATGAILMAIACGMCAAFVPDAVQDMLACCTAVGIVLFAAVLAPLLSISLGHAYLAHKKDRAK